MANYSQRYNATTQTTAAGAFKFDTISSVDWPVAKLIWGAEGVATYASAANPLPVTISDIATATNQSTANGLLTTIDTDTGSIATSAASIDSKTPALGQALAAASVPVVLTAAQLSTLTPPAAITGYSTLAEQQTQTTHLTTIIGHVDGVESALTDAVASLNVMDDWDETNRCAVNLIVGQAGITAGAGAVAANTPRVTHASDDPAVTSLQLIDDVVYTTATAAVSKVIAIGAQDTAVSGQVQALQIDPNNNGLMVSLAGANGSIFVKGIDAHDAGPVSSPIMVAGGYASAAAPASVSTDGDAVYQWHLRNGSPVCNLAVGGTLVTGSAGLPVAQQGTWNVGTVTTVTTCSTVTTLTGGGVAHDSADSGNPIKVGARAAATLSDDTMVANADRTDAVSDLDGAIIVREGFPLGDLISERVTDTSGTSTAFTNFGATASTRNYVTAITVYNSSATAGTVDFRDGTGGSVLWTMPIPAGGGSVISMAGVPLFCTTANTALAYDVSGALTTVTISISGFKSKARA